jgi:hypothetical protein
LYGWFVRDEVTDKSTGGKGNEGHHSDDSAVHAEQSEHRA